MLINSYKCRYLLCDSLKAYKSYVGKVKYDKLLTLSPTLILKKGIKSESLYKPWSTTRLKKFQQSIYPCNAEVFNKLQNNQFISNEENLVINIALNR